MGGLGSVIRCKKEREKIDNTWTEEEGKSIKKDEAGEKGRE